MIVFSTFIFPDFKNHGIESSANPANGAILFRPILALIEVIRMTEYLLCLFKTNTALWILSENCTFPLVKLKAH
jgi:hypothetical protein